MSPPLSTSRPYVIPALVCSRTCDLTRRPPPGRTSSLPLFSIRNRELTRCPLITLGCVSLLPSFCNLNHDLTCSPPSPPAVGMCSVSSFCSVNCDLTFPPPESRLSLPSFCSLNCDLTCLPHSPFPERTSFLVWLCSRSCNLTRRPLHLQTVCCSCHRFTVSTAI